MQASFARQFLILYWSFNNKLCTIHVLAKTIALIYTEGYDNVRLVVVFVDYSHNEIIYEAHVYSKDKFKRNSTATFIEAMERHERRKWLFDQA